MLDHTNFAPALTATQSIEQRTHDAVGDVIEIEERGALPPLRDITAADPFTPDVRN